MKQVLRQAADSVQTWLCSVRQMKAVYHQLNTFHVDVQRNCFVGEFWVPTKSLDDVTDRIHKSAVRMTTCLSSSLLVHGQVTIKFVVSVCLSVCLCRVFLSRL